MRNITQHENDTVFKDPDSTRAYTNAFLEEKGELPVTEKELVVWAVETYPEEFEVIV